MDEDCFRDNGEHNLKDWIVKIESPNFSRYAVSNENGDFRLAVDTGHYQVSLFAPNDNWQVCNGAISVAVPNFYDTVGVEIPVQDQFTCLLYTSRCV